MQLEQKIKILIDAANLVQKAGYLTLDDARKVLSAIDSINAGQNVNEAMQFLFAVAEMGQKHGVFTLKDSYTIYCTTLPDEQ